MNGDKLTNKELINQQKNNEPLTGLPVYTPGAAGFGLRDDRGNAVGNTWYSIETSTPSADDPNARIGDYVLQKGKAVVVPNSPTDLRQKYDVIVGGSGMTGKEAVGESVKLSNIGGGAVTGGVIGRLFGGPVGALVGTLGGALNAYNTAAEEALESWQNEEIKHDTAVEFYRDNEGALRYNVDYEKVGMGGPRSGEEVQKAQNTETEVTMGDDGRLKITVSPIFASTARYKELTNWISENYAGLTKDHEKYDEIVKEIRDGIDGEAQSYITNMKLYADYAGRFPDVSPETVVSAYMTEAAGYLDPEKMSDFQMVVVGDNGLETQTAAQFFDSVYNMNKDERNSFLEKLTNIVYGDNDYNESEKAIAYGELKSLYAVSRNTEGYENNKYQGMLDADLFVTFSNSFAPLGLSSADVINFVSGGNLMKSKQEFLNQNDLARFVGVAGGVGAGLGIWKGATSLIEKGLKLLPGTSALFNASLEGQPGGGMATILKEAESIGLSVDASASVAKAAAASAAFKTLKVGIFDAALAGSKKLVSNTDFWAEFGQDLARDITLEAIFSYYDMVSFEKAVEDSAVMVIRNPETGNLTRVTPEEGLIDINSNAEVVGVSNIQKTRAGDVVGVAESKYGLTVYKNGSFITVSPDGEVQKLLESSEGVTDGVPVLKSGVVIDSGSNISDISKLKTSLERMGIPKDVEIFSLPAQSASAAEVAGKLAKIDSSKAMLAINTNLFNRNAALDTVNELALAKTGDLTAWQNRSQKFVGITDNARQEINLMKTGRYVKSSEKAFEDYQLALGELNLTRRYTKVDANYLKAITQLERATYLDNHKVKGDTRNYTAEALEKYGDAIAKVPEDRAEVLKAFNEKRKARHDATKASAKKSGKIDVKELDKFMESDLQKEIGWVPLWGKKQTYNGLLSKFYGISQERNIYKSWLPEGGWVDLDELEDPVEADTRFLNFVATNMGITSMKEAGASALDDARMLLDNTPTSKTIREQKLASIKNKEELKSKLPEMVEAKKKEIKEKTLTQKEYKDWALGLYSKYGIDEAIDRAFSKNSITAKNWNQLWKDADAKTRKLIREELAKTAQQTGYGIKDTRARLNSLVPGADVLDWSLLGRDHTNGLVPGGLYAGKKSPVKAYIMSIDDLAKLAGYDLDKAIPDMGKVIESNINTESGIPMLPAHIRGSGDGPEIWLKMRWGHNSDSAANWIDYLKTLKERGIEKVPVAIDDARGDYNTTFYRVKNTGIAQKGLDNIVEALDKAIATGKSPEFTARDVSAALHVPGWTRDRLRRRIRNSIPATSDNGSAISDMEIKNLFDEADEYNWSEDEELNSLTDNIESVVEEKLGYAPQDITADVQQAFSEYGRIPFYRGQSGLGQFNMNDLSPTEQVGDAYWIAPNASYTDSYGKDKIAGTIPVKYFMSDKEKTELVSKIKEELLAIKKEIGETAQKKFDELEKWMVKELDKPGAPGKERVDSLFDAGQITWAERPFVAVTDFINSGNKTQQKKAREFRALYRDLRSTSRLTDADMEGLPKNDFWKKVKRYNELGGIVDDIPYAPMSGDAKDQIVSYRALAEYAKKPIIDISEDGFADGTAFFYYKGVDPKFDKEIGEQLAAQAVVEGSGWTYNKIVEQAEKLDSEMTVQDLINFFLEKEESRIPELASDFLTDMYNAIDEGNVADTQQYWNDFLNQIVSDEPELEAVRETLDRSWDGDMLRSGVNSPEDVPLKLEAIIHTRGDGTNIARSLYDFLELPTPESELPAPTEEQTVLASQGKPKVEDIPNQPKFRQPNKVTYNDYDMGIKANSSSKSNIRRAIKASQINDLVKRVRALLYEAAEYNKITGYNFDTKSYLNTSTIPDISAALKARNKSAISSIVSSSILNVAPYRSQALLLKSAQDLVAEDWRAWAEEHIKAGRASTKVMKTFVEDNNLELPDDKRPLPNKVKHALWERVQSQKRLPRISGINPGLVSKDMNKEDFYKMLDETPLFQSTTKNKSELVDLVAAEINGETLDAYEMGAAITASGLGHRYPITWFRNGRPYTRFITYKNKEEQRLAEAVTEIFSDKQLLKQPGVISRVASQTANDFRLLATGFDSTRAPLNFARDTGRGQITSGGQSFINPNKVFKSLLEVGDYTAAEKEKLSKALDNVADMVGGETYNAAYRGKRNTIIQVTKQYLSKTGASPLRKFTYNVLHDKRSILEKPADLFEGLTRKRLAKSAATVKLRQLQKEGASFEEQLKGMMDAAFFAGREYTANFARKGKLIEQTSKYIAYQSSAYAGLDGMKRAFINNPEGVSKNFAVFLIMYLILLADTLGDEESRKNYYRLSEYDRGNSLVFSVDDNTVVTIPLDQEVAGFLFPYRRFMETLNGTDPVSFFEFVWGTLTEPLPMDLSGFSEGEGFNLVRGVQKLTSQNMPNILTGIQEASTGYDLYYGSDISVTDETLKDYGIYDPDAGDYTTAGKDSLTLRQIANATGIPQWQLQAMISSYGGNVGSYILNILDKLRGATEEQQGGKDFVNAIFKSFVATDQDAAESAFYDGIKQLQGEKRKLVQQVADYNEKIKTASGEAKVELQIKLQKAKDEFAIKVADFVDKYISAYEITGGLPKNQAMQVYYLFRLDDDDTVYEEGSPEQYYKTRAEQRFKNQATAMSAPILDRYYNNRIGNIYQDANGVWRRYLSSGVQAMRNSIYGQGEEHMVSLLNVLEGRETNLTSLRDRVKDARSVAYERKDYDTADKLAYDFDKKVIEAISPYIKRYGAENVLGNNEVLDYLSDWFFVPDNFKRTKRGKYVSLAHNASSQEAFVRPYIKYIFGLPTNYYSYSDTSLTSPSLGEFGR